MKPRLIAPVALVAVGFASLVALAPAHALSRAVACQLTGYATFTPGLDWFQAREQVGFQSMKLSACRGFRTSQLAVPQPMTAHVGILPNPVPTTAGCLKGGVTMTAVLTWDDGSITTTTITTRGLVGPEPLTGTVTKSNSPSVRPGDTLTGGLVFKTTHQIADMQDCVKRPVTFETISGHLLLSNSG
jgi:hypothetical protein